MELFWCLQHLMIRKNWRVASCFLKYLELRAKFMLNKLNYMYISMLLSVSGLLNSVSGDVGRIIPTQLEFPQLKPLFPNAFILLNISLMYWFLSCRFQWKWITSHTGEKDDFDFAHHTPTSSSVCFTTSKTLSSWKICSFIWSVFHALIICLKYF